MPIISVIVPVYNVEPYLRRCVDSLLAQSFSDFEVILVDDGSPDNCGAICDEYAALDARVRVIHQDNGGLSAARNAGIDWAFRNSDSQWLAFVDSDDWVHPQYLELLYRAAEEKRVQISVCEFERVDTPSDPPPLSSTATVFEWDRFLPAHSITGVIAWNKLYHKDLFRELRYPVGKYHEDEYLTYKLLFLAQNVAYIPAVLYYYYQNPEGVMNSAFSLKRLDSMAALEERLSFTRQHGCRQLFLFDIRRYLHFCVLNHEMVESAESIPDPVRTQVLRDLRCRARKTVLRYGPFNLSPFRYRWYYLFAFPHLLAPFNAIYHLLRKPVEKES